MDPKLRTILIGLISLAAVLAIYLVYSQISKTPQIDIVTGAGFADALPDSNVGDSDGQIAKIGNVGVSSLKKTKLEHRDKDGEVDREFGFEVLLHKAKDVLEVQRPYMNLYQADFTCYITADKGMVQLETAVGRFTPKDATFMGNVVVHVLPEAGRDIKESFVYLDDIAFLSEKSQFSTAGPISFASQDAEMLGKGMELVYDDELDRLEFFRLIHLVNLHFRRSKAALFSPASPGPALADPAETPALSPVAADANSPNDTSSGITISRAAKPVVADDSQKGKMPLGPNGPEDGRAAGEYYRCVFRKSVVIDMPKQWVFAEDEVVINNIFWPKSSDKKSSETKTIGPDDLEPTGKRVSEPGEPNALSGQLVDIVVTCDNGIIVTPMNSPLEQRDAGELGTDANVPSERRPQDSNGTEDRATLVARKIAYDVATGNAIADGPLELQFHTADLIVGAAAKGTPADSTGLPPDHNAQQATIPVRISAQKKAAFLSDSNQVSFEGNCECTMRRQDSRDPNVQEKYVLWSQRLTVDVPSDVNDQSGPWPADIDHLTADGGLVTFSTTRSIEQQVVGGIRLECRKLDYDRQQQLFSATGPDAKIIINNSSVPEPNEQVPGFSLKRPGWAFIENFDTLQYFVDANRFIADANSHRITISGFPFVKGQYKQHVEATAGRIEGNLTQTADGQMEISTLTASRGITYEDGDNEFAGSELFYDHDKSIVKIWGDESQPCYFNGVLVDEIQIDLETGNVKAKVPLPGALQIQR
jgi:hypothetical protein